MNNTFNDIKRDPEFSMRKSEKIFKLPSVINSTTTKNVQFLFHNWLCLNCIHDMLANVNDTW